MPSDSDTVTSLGQGQLASLLSPTITITIAIDFKKSKKRAALNKEAREEFLENGKIKNIPGSPHPIPTSRYAKNIITTTPSTTSLTFFHQMRRLRSRLRTRKSRADPPSRSVWLTSRSIRSPRSMTRSMLSVMTMRASASSARAVVSASGL